jgi:hypothetical protein
MFSTEMNKQPVGGEIGTATPRLISCATATEHLEGPVIGVAADKRLTESMIACYAGPSARPRSVPTARWRPFMLNTVRKCSSPRGLSSQATERICREELTGLSPARSTIAWKLSSAAMPS